MYSLREFGAMIADPGRFGAYAKAIARAVRPGDTVAEIGCGPDVFSLLACQAGARRDCGIESEECIQFARQLAAANGFADRIEFFQCDSRKAELPERANVIISDIRGALPLHDNAIHLLDDARERLLAPGGIMVPQRDTLKAAVIEAEEFYSRLITPWRNSVSGIDLSPALLPVLNQFYTSIFKNEQILTQPQDWGLLDYTVGASTRAAAELHFHVGRDATAYGVCLWFDTQLFEDIGYTSAPGTTGTVHGQFFLPWLEPVPIQKGAVNSNLAACRSRWPELHLAVGNKDRCNSRHSGVQLSAIEFSGGTFFVTIASTCGRGLRSPALGGSPGRSMDAGKNGWRRFLAANC